jgi:hypothetical protein
MAEGPTGLHVLLTYRCTLACDHCFVWGSPSQQGVMTLEQLEDAYEQARETGTIKSVCFEGGEPFLYYGVLVRAVELARTMGLSPGIVSNAYWATTERDAVAWLEPLARAGLGRIDLSSDLFHGEARETPESTNGIAAARKLGISVGSICIASPEGASLGGVMYRGRAAAKLVSGRPTKPWATFDRCPAADFDDPGRVHLDALGNVFTCQGILFGNIRRTRLKELFASHDPHKHPIIGPLLVGGPAELVRRHGATPEPAYVDACHLCYSVRAALLGAFPDALGPGQVYGEYES